MYYWYIDRNVMSTEVQIINIEKEDVVFVKQ